jgi:pimeloyl-ACP methyl ester carboxylesterase
VFEALRPSAREAFEEFAGAGHAICQEQPAAVARAITAIAGDKATTHA